MPQRFLESHNGLSAKLVEDSDYDGIWVSSLTHAASLGLPDNELVPAQERISLVREIRRVTTKPILVDIDTGGKIEHLETLIKWFEDAGAWGVIMEDKRGRKANSLLAEGAHELEDVDHFAAKIKEAKKGNIKVFARLESLIAKKSKYDALVRANAYLDAGADGIMVHSKAKVDATEVMEVGNELKGRTTLIAVPTTYTLPEDHPFDIVIHANQMLRASLYAMLEYVGDMDPPLAEVSDLFEIVGS